MSNSVKSEDNIAAIFTTESNTAVLYVENNDTNFPQNDFVLSETISTDNRRSVSMS